MRFYQRLIRKMRRVFFAVRNLVHVLETREDHVPYAGVDGGVRP